MFCSIGPLRKNRKPKLKQPTQPNISSSDDETLPQTRLTSAPKPKFRIPKVPNISKVADFPEDFQNAFICLQKLKKEINGITKENCELMAQVAAKPSKSDEMVEFIVEDDDSFDQEAKFDEEFLNLEQTMCDSIDEDEFCQLVTSIDTKMNKTILPKKFLKSLSTCSDDTISLHLIRSLKEEEKDVQLALYPVLLCKLVSTILKENTNETLETWNGLQSQFQNFLNKFKAEVKPCLLLASIHMSFRQIVRRSKTVLQFTSLFTNVMPLYNRIFVRLSKRKDFSVNDEQMIASILFYIFGFQALVKFVEESPNITHMTMEHYLIRQLMRSLLICCNFDVSSIFERFTALVYNFLADKPIESALKFWLDLIKTLPFDIQTGQQHVLYLVSKQISSQQKKHIDDKKQQLYLEVRLSTILASNADVLNQLKLILAHLNRKQGKKKTKLSSQLKESKFSETSYLIAMLYFAGKPIPHQQPADLLKLVQWFHDSVKHIENRSKLFIVQLEGVLSEQAEFYN